MLAQEGGCWLSRGAAGLGGGIGLTWGVGLIISEQNVIPSTGCRVMFVWHTHTRILNAEVVEHQTKVNWRWVRVTGRLSATEP